MNKTQTAYAKMPISIPDNISSTLARAHEGRAPRIESPTGHEEPHRLGIVARGQPDLLVQPVRLVEPVHVELDPEPGPVRDGDRSAGDDEGFLGQPLSVLPDPVRIDGRDASGRRGG